jgi:hypothetical protein
MSNAVRHFVAKGIPIADQIIGVILIRGRRTPYDPSRILFEFMYLVVHRWKSNKKIWQF